VLARRARYINCRDHADHDHRPLLVAGRRAPVREHVRAHQSRGYVAVLFVASMLTLVVGLLSFLLEVRISIASLTIGTLAKKSPGFVARGE
jgi:hypothetical protein